MQENLKNYRICIQMDKETTNRPPFKLTTINPDLAERIKKQWRIKSLTEIDHASVDDVMINVLPSTHLQISAPNQEAYSQLLKRVRDDLAVELRKKKR